MLCLLNTASCNNVSLRKSQGKCILSSLEKKKNKPVSRPTQFKPVLLKGLLENLALSTNNLTLKPSTKYLLGVKVRERSRKDIPKLSQTKHPSAGSMWCASKISESRNSQAGPVMTFTVILLHLIGLKYSQEEEGMHILPHLEPDASSHLTFYLFLPNAKTFLVTRISCS